LENQVGLLDLVIKEKKLIQEKIRDLRGEGKDGRNDEIQEKKKYIMCN